MMNAYTGNAMWHLVKQSDMMSKGVMLLLLGMSIVCWALFFYKLIALRLKQYQMSEALGRLKQTESLEQLLVLASTHAHTAVGYFLAKNLTLLKGIREDNRDKSRGALTAQQWNCVEQSVQQTIDEMMDYEESGLAVLSASAAVAPLLGLFGTVWGLVHAFISISEKQSADIAAVAPGIAEALMTTLAGLMVAIPALCMFHYVMSRIAGFGQSLVAVAQQFSFIIQKIFFW